jgi:hypothetical protein
MREMTKAQKIVIGKPDWKRPHGKSRSRREDNNQMYLR